MIGHRNGSSDGQWGLSDVLIFIGYLIARPFIAAAQWVRKLFG